MVSPKPYTVSGGYNCDESGPVPEVEWIVDDVMMMYPGSETVFSG